MLENIRVLCHSSIKIEKEKIIYIDPFKIEENYLDADIIFITHDHYDHYSKEDIEKIKKENTVIVIPKEMLDKVEEDGFRKENIVAVEPNETYKIGEILVKTVRAYNKTKQFHPKENNWVGYIIEIQGVSYYIAGDTDFLEENKNIKCNVAFVPVGGTYTMNVTEAAEFVNTIKPEFAVPTHYGTIVGSKEDGEEFVKLLEPEIKGRILMA